MRKTLRLSFSLKNTYRVNAILYSLRQAPLIKRLVPADAYRRHGFKVLANILSVIWEILSVFVGKVLYVAAMILGPISLLDVPAEAEAQLFLHLFLLLSLVGAAMNTYLFDPSKDKYYAMVLLGMDAREYTLANCFYALAKVLAGFALCAVLFGPPAGLSLGQCLIIPPYVAGVKMIYSAWRLMAYEKGGRAYNEARAGAPLWVATLALLGAAYGLPCAGLAIPAEAAVACMAVGILLGMLALWKILAFAHYPTMYKELLTDALVTNPITVQSAQADASRKSISADAGITSQRKGLEYLNELFVKRHRKLLWKSSKRIAGGVLIAFVACVIAMRHAPSFEAGLNSALMSYLPYLTLVMYVINRGAGFTQALFINCDRSLLTYPFYKQPESILRLFWIRLREIVKVNLLPAVTIALALAVLLYLSGGTDDPANYAVIVASVPLMSVFLSVHYLTLYYLLQPYSADTEVKSVTSAIAALATYAICYLLAWIRIPAPAFGAAVAVFCISYCVVASVLVYRLAPRTFRLRL